MTVTVDEDIVKIHTKIGELAIHAKECSQEVIDDALVIGRYTDKLRQEDLAKIYKATGQFYNECICTKKIKK